MKKQHVIAVMLLSTVISSAFSQEALKSTEEEYYDFLSLDGIVERPFLNYRTLSDSVWTIPEDAEGNIWAGNNLGSRKQITDHISYKLFGPDWFNSFNTAAPYGQNDGALWQGKGYNTSLTAGAMFEAYGFSVTVKPQICFQQNMKFDLLSSNYDSEYGYIRGYQHNVGIDMPQRFGDKPFFTFDWGDSEIRYTWKTLTAGFGTEALWIGSAWLNPLISSNNAATYPKFDIGIRRQSIIIPKLGWYLGDIEARMWIGYLTESDYFDSDSSNDHNLYNGFSISYAPPYLTGLSLSVTKICLSKWNDESWKYINPFHSTNDYEDQKVSFSVDWLQTKIGLELYGEFALDDYLQGGFLFGGMRYPFDTLVWTAGLKKAIPISEQHGVSGELILETTFMELSRNKPRNSYSFNMHHQITQGYTQRGQAIGSSLGVGGNSELIQFNLYYPKGVGTVLIMRNNPDDTYSYVLVGNENQTYKANFVAGLSNAYYITPCFSFSGGIYYDLIINPYYHEYEDNGTKIAGSGSEHNFSFTAGLKYQF